MAGVSTEPEPFFRLSPAELGKTQFFGVTQGKSARRLNANFHQPIYQLLEIRLQEAVFTCRSLLEICSIISDGTHHTPKYLDSGNLCVHFISVKDVREWEVNFENTKFISEEEHQVLAKRCSPKANDILLTKIGTIGKAALVPLDAPIFDIFVSVALLRVREDRALPTFITYFLNSDTARMQFNRVVKGVGVPDLHLEDIAEIKVALPGIAKQHELIAAMDKARSQRRQKLAEADTLLSSLDEFILNALDISLPSPDSRKAYAICLSQMLGERVDAYSNQPYFQKLFTTIKSSQHPVTNLGNIAEPIFSGTTPLAKGDAYVDPPNGVRFVRSGEITKEGGVTPTSEVHIREEIHNGKMKRSQLQRGDILIAIVGATIGAIGIYDFNEPANINQAIAAVRMRYNDVLVEYVCWYLRCSLGQGLLDYFKRPVARANINLTEVGEIPIIIPSQEVQKYIIAEVHSRREEARRLRSEADTGWQNVKQWFEEQLLGSVPL